MKLQTKLLTVALEWVEKNWKSKQGYNLTMSKISHSTPAWALVLIKDIKEIKQDIVEIKKDIVELKRDVVELKKDVAELKKDMALIKSLPTIKKEIAELQAQE